jgi:gas vesicle protein
MRAAKKAYSDVRPYVQRAVSDEEVRDNLKDAFYAAKEIYDELFGGRSRLALAQRVATDAEIRDNLKKISDDLRSTVDRVQGKAEHTGRNLFLLLTGVVIGVLFNPVSGPQTRKWLKDKIFGAEPEFSYQGNGPAASASTSSSSGSSSS